MNQKKFYINWQRVLLIVLLFCIIFIVIYLTTFYRSIEKSRISGYAEAEDFVMNNSKVSEINKTSYFQEAEGFFTFIGKDEKEEEVYIFLRDDEKFEKEDLYILPKSRFIPIEELEEAVLEECANCSLIKSTPAMIDEIPLWELTYNDDRNRYVIEYKYLENGKTFEKLRLTRKYKKD